MRLFKVFGVMYLAAVCMAQDPLAVTSMDIFTTSQPSTESQTIYEPPVPSLYLQSPWLEVFPSEKAQLRCSINDSTDWSFTWYKSGTQVQEADPNLSFNLSHGAVLTIIAASQAYSGMYRCKGHHKVKGNSTNSDPLQLKVYANKPNPTLTQNPKLEHMYPGESVTFLCMIYNSSGWDYMWFHNDKEIQESNNHTYRIDSLVLSDSGRYHCKAKRGKSPFYTEQSETSTLQVSEPPTPTLKLVTSWLDVFENETVELTCDMDSSNWTFTWHRNEKALLQDPALDLSAGGSLLNITSASQALQGKYACKAHHEFREVTSVFSNTAIVQVYGNTPKPSLSKDPVLNSMYVGENTTFTCNVDVATDWEYQWYKDGKQLTVQDKTLQINRLSPHDGGTYWCKATRGQRTSTYISDKMTQDVLEIPVPSVALSTQWADVFPTESVTLSCAITKSSDWMYTWQRNGQVIQTDGSVSFGSDGTTLSIVSAAARHQGQYSCSGKLKSRSVSSSLSSGVAISVYGYKPQIILVQDPDYTLMHTGDSVSYSCHINVSSGWEYRWYKDDTPLTVSGNNYTISPVAIRNTGSYQCQAIRGRTTGIFETEQSLASRLQVEERPSANIIVLTGWSEVFSTDSLVLQCEVKGSKDTWNYTWFMKGQGIVNSSSDKYTVTPQNDPEQSQYTCQGIRTGRPSYSTKSDSLTTKNLLLKRRVLLSISGCIFFGIVAVFFGCIILKITRKTEDDEERPEEGELFLTMAQLKDRVDAACLLVDYITDTELNAPAKESEDITCSETTQLPVISQEDHAVTTESTDKPEEDGALLSFQH
ncbi:B-cell receptor CD22 isoform X2 [Dunckerocampus dactyliophorus]|uniref:B-cell receptor CD22 isoform X2 n=1 Tax=Dunckerocampus dactyliophorus TaxID=161453 RepID=UPI002404AF12|nr:B-cell receptor CD22 isoform X2 [Dunckerocampus dactyliophorus]